MFCSKCGKNVADGVMFCDNCGNRLNGEDRPISQNTFQQAQTAPMVQTAPKTNVMSIAGFGLGLVSLILNFIGIVGIVALILSIVGLTQIKNSGGKGKGLAITGIILGAIGVIFGLFSIMQL